MNSWTFYVATVKGKLKCQVQDKFLLQIGSVLKSVCRRGSVICTISVATLGDLFIVLGGFFFTPLNPQLLGTSNSWEFQCAFFSKFVDFLVVERCFGMWHLEMWKTEGTETLMPQNVLFFNAVIFKWVSWLIGICLLTYNHFGFAILYWFIEVYLTWACGKNLYSFCLCVWEIYGMEHITAKMLRLSP